MLRIEFMGPPGVGKTTVVRRLQDDRAPGLPALHAPQWLPLWAEHQRKRPNAVTRNLESILYARKGLRRWMRPRLEKEMIRHALRALRDAPGPWPEFLRGALGTPDPEIPEALALERLRSFAFSAAQAWVADSLHGQGAVVFDEGLAQRGISLGQGMDVARTREYYRRMPAPAAVVRVRASSAEIQARLRTRNPDVTRFNAMVERAFEIGELAGEALGTRGIPVVDIDASGDVESAVQETARALKGLSVMSGR
ncbi:hypothetical protein [Thioalkalivibrio sp. AKL17]|uniref:hypothetical protein n=1 Tax=Thioalkalivibrio sp. AKL17 TaxID=1158160 RepID=UPI000370B415|nr:hypothetical protein [Thioalkalivibrio sp. AKL17]